MYRSSPCRKARIGLSRGACSGRVWRGIWARTVLLLQEDELAVGSEGTAVIRAQSPTFSADFAEFAVVEYRGV